MFVALGIQHTMCIHCIMSSMAYPTLQYFFTSPHKLHDLKKKVIERKMCVLIFSRACV
jgi:hypothetical protein